MQNLIAANYGIYFDEKKITRNTYGNCQQGEIERPKLIKSDKFVTRPTQLRSSLRSRSSK